MPTNIGYRPLFVTDTRYGMDPGKNILVDPYLTLLDTLVIYHLLVNLAICRGLRSTESRPRQISLQSSIFEIGCKLVTTL